MHLHILLHPIHLRDLDMEETGRVGKRRLERWEGRGVTGGRGDTEKAGTVDRKRRDGWRGGG